MLNALFRKHREKKRKEFTAKLKYGEDWHQKLYPHKYTGRTGLR